MRCSAHPGQQQNFSLVPALVEARLCGLELCHPSNGAADRAQIRELAARHGLFCTGGSDFHGAYEAAATGWALFSPPATAPCPASATRWSRTAAFDARRAGRCFWSLPPGAGACKKGRRRCLTVRRPLRSGAACRSSTSGRNPHQLCTEYLLTPVFLLKLFMLAPCFRSAAILPFISSLYRPIPFFPDI